MAETVVVDSGFVVAFLRRRDSHHAWAVEQGRHYPPPWHTCEAVLSETFFILRADGPAALIELTRRGSIACSFRYADDSAAVLELMQKYRDVPMSFADACLVCMTERLPNAVLLTTDSDFRIYRQQNRRVVPCVLP